MVNAKEYGVGTLLSDGITIFVVKYDSSIQNKYFEYVKDLEPEDEEHEDIIFIEGEI